VEVIEHLCDQAALSEVPAVAESEARPCGLDLASEGQVLGQGRLGVRLASLVAYLRITLRLPLRLIQSYLETIHKLKVSVGEIVYLLDQVREKTKAAVEALRDEALKSGVLHADETGWREAGQNGYIWAFSTPGGVAGKEAVRYYERDQHRSQSVVRRMLGNRFKGVLVSDFYVAYNDYECRKQRCWSHLLRDLHELKEKHQGEQTEDSEAVKWAQAVRALYDEAQAFVSAEVKPSQEEREKKYVSLVERVHGLGLEHARARRGREHPTTTLGKRVLLHEDELFQFVLVEGLSPNNNLAERSIRPLVVIRKISGGSRSDSGSKTTMALASLLETWRVRGLNPFQEGFQLLSQNPTPSPA
jgi:transposase